MHTAFFGAIEAFEAHRVVFASDSLFHPEGGPMYIRETIKVLGSFGIPEERRGKIYYRNAFRPLKLKGTD